MSSKAKRPRKINGYKMPPSIPAGFIIKSKQKESWKIGASVGKGGFGEIYCCSPVSDDTGSSKTKNSSQSNVAKIEPQENGPLFVEMHFYMKVAKKEQIETWMKSKGIKSLGMPCYIGSGLFDFNNERFRFVVMDRYGKDLWSIFLENNKCFPCSTSLQIGLQIIDVLEYIHFHGYAHCDVKGSNLLMSTAKGKEDQVYLVDFGLAHRYNTGEFKPDPKKAHNGTIEYTSRDAHLGVVTQRGDMEILGFNLLHWVNSTLPWDNISDPKLVEDKKNLLMNNFSSSSKKMIPTTPPVITKYLEYVSKLKHNEAPDYGFCKKLFLDELKKLGAPSCGKFIFKTEKLQRKTPQKSRNARTKKGVETEMTLDDNDVSNSEDDFIENEVPAKSPKKKVISRNKEKGASWKDCDTAKASKVVKAGEYISANPKPVKRQKKE